MTKTNIVFLKPGATVVITAVGGSTPISLGYTRGIVFASNYSLENLSNQKVPGYVRSVLINISGKFSVNMIELSQANLNLLYMNSTDTANNYTVAITGVNRESASKTLTLTLNNAFLESVGSLKFAKSEEGSFDLVFQACLDTSGVMGTITLT